jgi:predicted O-linked N-acetylglucosamine transferase (SPINDLY family)
VLDPKTFPLTLAAQVEPLIGQANQAMQAGQWARAEQLATQALALAPHSYEARQIRALALLHAGRADEALAHAELLIERFPSDPFAHNTYGAVLQAVGRTDKAIKAFRKSVSLAPQHYVSWLNLSLLYMESGNVEEALEPAREATRRAPGSPDAARIAAQCELEVGDLAASVEGFRRLESLASPPDGWRFIRSIAWSPLVDSREQIAHRRDQVERSLDDLIARPAAITDPLHEVGMTGFYMAYQGFDDTQVQRKIADALRLASPGLEWRAPHVARKRSGGRIRVAIVSRHLNNHTIGKLNIGIAQKLDRDRFEVVVMRPPCERDFLAGAFDDCASATVTLPFDLAAARRMIAQAEPDAIFYPDIGMDVLTYYLAFARLARVQFTTWGHPVTTGIPNVDYYLSARHAEPLDGQRFYSERLVELESPPSYYYRPRPPSSFDLRSHLGARADERIYASLQTLYKMHPDFDDVLVEILRRDPRGRVVLIAAKREGWNAKLRRRLDRAGPDVASRFHFIPMLPLPDYLAALKSADALLDTFHFGGGSSSYESFGMSAPVVTLPGERMRSRITAALYTRMGQSRWVALSAGEFVNLAVELAHGSDAERIAWRREIAEGANAFLENDAVIREYEGFIAAAVAAGAAS